MLQNSWTEEETLQVWEKKKNKIKILADYVSIYRYYRKILRCDILICDEAHHKVKMVRLELDENRGHKKCDI